MTDFDIDLPLAILDVVPNPILVKDSALRYLWVNSAFEELFGVHRSDLRGQLDTEAFPNRQAAQCNGGDMRVLNDGVIDEAYETVFQPDGTPRVTLTRKNRLTLPSGANVLVGVLHDLTDVIQANDDLKEAKRRLEKQAEELSQLANTDGLSGCLNRRALFNRVAELSVTEDEAGLLLLDLDHFKRVNDRYGHAVGDACLVQFAQTVRAQLRDEDLFSRLGGEEFVIYVPGIQRDELAQISDRICKAVEATPIRADGVTVPITVSIGASGIPPGAIDNLEDILRRADVALYEAKGAGRNQYKLSPEAP